MDVEQPYVIARSIQGSVGQGLVQIGERGRCRFCGNTDLKFFRKVAHTFPEALGNKWIVSLDECDLCNEAFSVYEDALAKAVGSVLTIGGTLGKGNKVRQTGRSRGNTVISHGRNENGKRRLTLQAVVADFKDAFTLDAATNLLHWKMPVPAAPFSPLLAYKALVKMGLSLVPTERLGEYSALLDWVRRPLAAAPEDSLRVGLSFGAVGNSPQLVVGTLLRRIANIPEAPETIFIYCAGSVCIQIDLAAALATAERPASAARLNFQWINELCGAPQRPATIIRYGAPIELDWSSATQIPTPIETLKITFNPTTLMGSIMPILRTGQPPRKEI
ncbi:hypothetical protein [Caulobacter sp. BK020]|uniref:hypothetical protein n=1 Tax=Caulobacter sp. BK020 TaxID=2512117 RepID=UPI0010527458|nr:hypothetical protein [Caulobacter sp. BK020]TCS18340.1 hypothetical protein EV278_101324 [Caulobacter sp. BK020]